MVTPYVRLVIFSSTGAAGVITGFRLSGNGTPAFAHMAAAFALAISSSWALSRSVRRFGDLAESIDLSLDLDRFRRMGDLLKLFLLIGDLDRRLLTGDLHTLALLPGDLDFFRLGGVRLFRLCLAL